MPAWQLPFVRRFTVYAVGIYLYLTYHHQSLRPTDYVFPFFCFIIYFGCIKADFWKLLYLYIFVFDYIIFVPRRRFFSGILL